MSATGDRRIVWENHYHLLPSHPKSGGSHCLRALLGLRCLKRYGRRIGRYLLGDKACNGDISSAIGDHGRFYHLAGERHASLFIGQPYGNGTITPGMENDLAIARDLGLHIHVGALGEAWYNDSVTPIIISQHPIPDHKYIYRGEYV